MPLRVWPAVLAALLLAAPAAAQRDLYGLPGGFQQQRRAYEARARQEVGELLAAFESAWGSRDPEAMARLYARSAVLYAPDGRTHSGRGAVRRWYAGALAQATPVRASVSDFRLTGDLATVAVLVEPEAEQAASTHLLRLRRGYTAGEGWTILSHHAGTEAAAFDGEHLRLFARDVLASISARGVFPGAGWFVLRADSGHANVGATFVQADVPDNAHTGLRGVVTSFLEAHPGGEPLEVAFRLNEPVLVLGEPMAAPPPGRTRLPVPRNLGYVQALARAAMLSLPGATPGARHTARVRALVTTQGRVAMLAVERWTGVPELDRYIVPLTFAMVLEPARVGEQPVPMWITLPLTFASDSPK
jgi:uncharacterized protein (TIGR02246 family)